MTEGTPERKALENIRRMTALHFLGGAFDPEHMRAISNYCADVLDGEHVPNVEDDVPEAYFLRVLRENGWKVTRIEDDGSDEAEREEEVKR